MRPWLTIALAAVATAEDEALAAYVRFAKNTLPKLENAWAAPHRADAVKSKKGRVLVRRGYHKTHRHARRALPRPLGRLRRAGHQAVPGVIEMMARSSAEHD